MQKLILSFFFFPCLLQAQQNLVPNPSFEERTGCPQGYPDLDGVVKDWISFRATPDYFNNCSPVCGYSNTRGFQEPHTGEAYTGIGIYDVNIQHLREHLAVKLISGLVPGVKYYLSFYTCVAYNYNTINIAANNLGILFTTYPYSTTDGDPLPNNSHLNSTSIIADSIIWTKVSGSFLADSAYEYVVIGGFFDDSEMDTFIFENPWGPFSSYYFIDDVCVSTDSLFNENWTNMIETPNKNSIEVFPNPAFDLLHLKANLMIEEIFIMSYTGQVLLQKKEDINIIDISSLSSGCYFIYAQAKDFNFTIPFFKQTLK